MNNKIKNLECLNVYMFNELKAAAVKHPAGIYSLPFLVLTHFLSQRGISQLHLHRHLREKAP